jgi:S-adenosylmethionine:tRNA ribosyltransferase-isomerase
MSDLDHYDYHLPRELIAQQPLKARQDARLLVVNRQEESIEHAYVRDLPQYLAAGDSLVLNDTRVIPARLVGRRERTNARWTGLFLNADENGNWQVLGKTRGKLESGEAITILSWDIRQELRLRLLANLGGGIWAVRPEPMGDALPLLEKVGRVPLPPYIRDGEMTEADRKTYQTVFAKEPGAVAAPTAGLHFTEDLFDELGKRGIQHEFVTLHVGIGTFRPISAPTLDEHVMHHEWCSVSAETVERLSATRARKGRIVAVGTTVVRTLETAAQSGKLIPFTGTTNLFIRPPYQFHAVDVLLTNFHLPRSTLLILVRAFGGDSLIRRAYEVAIRDGYRFFSYGDAMLIL